MQNCTNWLKFVWSFICFKKAIFLYEKVVIVGLISLYREDSFWPHQEIMFSCPSVWLYVRLSVGKFNPKVMDRLRWRFQDMSVTGPGQITFWGDQRWSAYPPHQPVVLTAIPLLCQRADKGLPSRRSPKFLLSAGRAQQEHKHIHVCHSETWRDRLASSDWGKLKRFAKDLCDDIFLFFCCFFYIQIFEFTLATRLEKSR